MNVRECDSKKEVKVLGDITKPTLVYYSVAPELLVLATSSRDVSFTGMVVRNGPRSGWTLGHYQTNWTKSAFSLLPEGEEVCVVLSN
jgi:hypothetical protein